ncbi:hypothetical protein D3C72_2354200 [compost metagenome]
MPAASTASGMARVTALAGNVAANPGEVKRASVLLVLVVTQGLPAESTSGQVALVTAMSAVRTPVGL